ncbi:type II toxin-antitoxin system RelB/DinJ family antitoxin [Maribrevibacterium harenarium]|uniref:Type II toxin-antitoxin system RelB/DinJ family antitoxin n=1 Tax=Maribrevibacterium harenarium TaxID=2589817 RepID=A0A501WLQ1_9GAMM|nr:type II toxin-antitoxin system RelB/DinJ family antitoxin [Maribrevibacterium harenarium]TPE49325.1 type II toxin-antitoxin system RelB/DinJ family antitoxin [Maribrevibacterium harenarium]
MSRTSMLHVRIDEELKADATAKLAEFGLTVSDAVRILLTFIAKEGGLPAGLTTDQASYDIWFRQKVHQALTEPGNMKPHHQVMEELKSRMERGSNGRDSMD